MFQGRGGYTDALRATKRENRLVADAKSIWRTGTREGVMILKKEVSQKGTSCKVFTQEALDLEI